MGLIKRSLSDKGGFVPIAMYSDHPKTIEVVRAMLDGAIDYLEWPFAAQRVRETITKIDGEVSLRLQEERRRTEATVSLSALTQRERDVLQEMVKGNGNKQIGKSLGISPRTVEIHRANMLTKLNARSSSAAIRLAIYAGLDSEE